ncbi:MAG: peptidoglycan DD-metalloendopeptidase family protein [Chloroflexi bacterium]|nr:peptidoglycan DD-metalloendopeptidase family protein [Chloroflexota bacterium]
MNASSKQPFTGAALLAALIVLLAACGPAAGGGLAQAQMLPTLAALAASPTATADLPTHTATAVPPTQAATAVPPTEAATAVPSATPTAKPTAAPTTKPTRAPTFTPTPTRAALAADLPQCPAEAPLKPEYERNTLGAYIWPAPDLALSSAHFWLAKPLPGGGRFLVNDTFPYGWDGNGRYLLHNGVDSAEAMGTAVLAAADGLVVYAGPDAEAWFGWRCDWYGHLVIIRHDMTWQGQPVYSLYGHVLGITVETGQRVVQGEQVAEIGVGGAATSPHLHFEVRIGDNAFGATRNPMLWVGPGETRGVLAGRLVDPDGRPWQGVTVTLVDGRDGQTQFLNTWTYLDDPDHLINPDEGYAENFVFFDLLPGVYTLYVKVQDIEYRQAITITAGELSQAEIITGPRLSETPAE